MPVARGVCQGVRAGYGFAVVVCHASSVRRAPSNLLRAGDGSSRGERWFMNRSALPCLYRVLAALFAFCFAPLVWAQEAAAPASPGLSPEETALLERVKVDTVRRVTLALTAPEMQGRGTGQPGGERAANYLAEQFKTMGLKPLGKDSTFLQSVRLGVAEPSPKSQIRINGGPTLTFGSDFYPLLYTAVQTNSPLAFIGYGVTSSDFGRDDLKGVDVRGKIVVRLSGYPDTLPMNKRQEWDVARARSSHPNDLLRKGAKAVLYISTNSTDEEFAHAAMYATRRSIGWSPNQNRPTQVLRTPVPTLPTFLLRPSGAAKLWATSNVAFKNVLAKAKTGAFVSGTLGKGAVLSFPVKHSEATASNVVGFLEGSDPELKREAVLFCAHYDAYGVDANGIVYPGAADNALGVAEMLALAEAIAGGPRPRRSVIFFAPTSEEYGLFGTRHYVYNAPWPIAQTVAVLNFDGIGTEARGPVRLAVGYGREYSTLGQTLQTTTAALSTLLISDPLPQENTFFRSDHYAFVQAGVPAIMVIGAPGGNITATLQRAQTLLSTHYHQPTDTVQPDWDWNGPRSLSALVLLTGWRVLQAETAPQWLSTSPYQRPIAKTGQKN